MCHLYVLLIHVCIFNATVFVVVAFMFYSLLFHKEKGKVLDLTTITSMLYFWIFMDVQLIFDTGLFRNIEKISFILFVCSHTECIHCSRSKYILVKEVTGACFFVVLHSVPSGSSGSLCHWFWAGSWITGFSYHSLARKVVQCCECKAKCLLPAGYPKEYRMLLYLRVSCVFLSLQCPSVCRFM